MYPPSDCQFKGILRIARVGGIAQAGLLLIKGMAQSRVVTCEGGRKGDTNCFETKPQRFYSLFCMFFLLRPRQSAY